MNLFKNKFFVCVFLFLIIITFFSSCFAVSSTIVINDNSYEVSSFIQSFDNIVIFEDRGYYTLKGFPSGSVVYYDGSDYFCDTSYYFCTFNYNNLQDLLMIDESKFSSSSGGTVTPYGWNIFYSYYDILDSDGDLVFQGALPVQTQVEPMKEITQVGEILPAIMKIVEIVLPIFLIIFGTLLVLYLIKSKNLLHL